MKQVTDVPDNEFQVMVMKIIAGCEKRVDDLRSQWELQQRENIQKNQLELKHSKNEVTPPEGIQSRLEDAEEHNNLEDSIMESNQAEEQEGKKWHPIRELSIIESNNICIKGIPEERERERKGVEKLFEEITENFPNLGKKRDIQLQEAHKASKTWIQGCPHQLLFNHNNWYGKK